MSLRLSAVVPTWNEVEALASTIESLRRGGVDEVIVVDGGSRDGTPALARELADRAIESPGGLFAQLNAGAREARGDVILFHYADVELPLEARAALEGALAREVVVGGAFRLELASPLWRYRVIARGASLRNRLGLGPFGDQTIFARASVFRQLGGYRPEMILADHDLMRRLRRAGELAFLPLAVRASVRRWERRGMLRTLLEHWWISALHVVGRRRRSSVEGSAAEELRTVR